MIAFKSKLFKSELIVLLLSLTVLILVLAGCSNNAQVSEDAQSIQTAQDASVIQQESSGFELISSGSTDEGSVSIDLKPIIVNNGRLLFEVYANTHSVDLSPYDLKKLTTLKFGGKVISPVEVPALSGHHTTGNLVFEVGNELETLESLGSFEVAISGVPNVEERNFKWG